MEHRESTFAGLCAAIARTEGNARESDFPLHGRVHLRSNIDMKFATREFSIEYPKAKAKGGGGSAAMLPTLRLGFLSLAGVGGALPLALSERMLHDSSDGGKALHAFLDLLNRRFWELLFYAQSAGGNPHYALLDSRHARCLADMSFAVAGLSDQFKLGGGQGSARLLHSIQRNCVSARHGMGDLHELGHLLSQMLGAEIRLQQHHPFRLKVISSSLARLGAQKSRARLGRNAVAGLSAWVTCAWVATVSVSHHDMLKGFLPGNAAFQRLHEVLSIFWGHARAPLALRLHSPVDASLSALGGSALILGWGARLGGTGPASQILDISPSSTVSITDGDKLE